MSCIILNFLLRFDIVTTKHYFLLSFAIPASLWIVSCSCLVSSNKVGEIKRFMLEAAIGRLRQEMVDPMIKLVVMLALF